MNQKLLIILTSILVIAHSAEEYFTSFQNLDAVFIAVHSILAPEWNKEMFFVIFQVFSDSILITALIILTQKKKEMWCAWLMSALTLLELSHILEAIMRQSYYPGLATALLYPFCTIAWWLYARHPSGRKVISSDSS